MMPMTGVAGPGGRHPKSFGRDRRTVHGVSARRRGQHPAREGVCGHPPAAAENRMHRAAFQIVQQQEVRQIAGRNQPPIVSPKPLAADQLAVR